MRFLLKFRIPIEAGNKALDDPEFGNKMQQLLTELNAETAYFTMLKRLTSLLWRGSEEATSL